MDLRRAGKKRAEPQAVVSEVLRNDMLRRRQMLSARSAKKLHYSKEGGFVWHPRPPQLRESALSIGQDAVCAVHTDASGLRGSGFAFGDAYIQGEWSKTEMCEGINGKELWVLKRS